MNRTFLNTILAQTAFPAEAALAMNRLADQASDDIDQIVAFFCNGYSKEDTQPMVEALAAQTGQSPYSVWMLVLLLSAEHARSLFPNDQVYWDTFSDLRYKVMECYEIHGVWGTFVAHWYPRFYKGDLIKLGRLEYESRPCDLKETVTIHGITVNPGDPIKHIHIPSSGEPFTLEARLDSYQKASAHFGNPLICLCSSWLLYPPFRNVLPPHANSRDFMNDFQILYQFDRPQFTNGWRIFGGGWTEDYAALPEKTTMQRAYKKYLLSGGTVGVGTGILIFQDGKLLTRDK